MSYMENGDRFKAVKSWWPIIITALAITVSAASASTRLDGLSERVTVIENRGPSGVNERLARIEARQEETAKTLARVENKLDDELTVSPASKKRLNRL